MGMERTRRSAVYDRIRALAILLVIEIHCIEGLSYYGILMNQVTVGIGSWLVQSVLYVVGRLGVPLFMLLTGALMLGRSWELDGAYLKKRVLPLYAATVLWTFGYFCVQLYKTGEPIFLTKMVSLFIRSCFLEISHTPHLWYMPVILGVYLFLPLLSRLAQAGATTLLVRSGIIVLLIYTFLPMVNRLFHVLDLGRAIDFSLANIRTGCVLTLYPLLILAGYLLRERQILQQIKSRWLVMMLVGCVTAVIVLQYISMRRQDTAYGHYFWYDNFFIVIAGVVLFELLSRLPSREGKVAFLVRNLSENSLGIYFVHVVIFWGIRRAMAETAWGWPLKFVAAFMGAWLVSWGLVQLLSQIPGVGWLLFHRPRRKGRSRQQG